MMSAGAAPLLGYSVPPTAIAPPRPSPPSLPPVAPPVAPPIRRFSSTSNTRITRGSSRRSLASELTARLKQFSWRLSTALLELQVAVRKATQAASIVSLASSHSPNQPTRSQTPSARASARQRDSSVAQRLVTTRMALSSAFGAAHERSLAKAVEEMSREADARAAAEAEAYRLQERAAEESAQEAAGGAARQDRTAADVCHARGAQEGGGGGLLCGGPGGGDGGGVRDGAA